jgi:hypothetical protein
VRPPVLSDALPTLKDRSTFLASEFIGRHDEDLDVVLPHVILLPDAS